jgi:hypothetical protein
MNQSESVLIDSTIIVAPVVGGQFYAIFAEG